MASRFMRSPRFSLAVAYVLALGTPACGEDSSNIEPIGDGGVSGQLDGQAGPVLINVRETHPMAAPIAPHTECTVTTADMKATSASHVETCSALELAAYPPASGRHFGSWANFDRYDTPVPWGFLLHSLEHGGVVLAYRCEDGCSDVLEAFEAVRSSIGADPACERFSPGSNRVIIAPDPDLEVPIAAVAWEHVYTATCLDEASLSAFVQTHYGMGPEDLCNPGVDLSSDGWCD